MKRLLAVTSLAAASLAFAADAPLRPDDFAFGLAIEPVAGAPLQQVTLPAAVYQSATRADLGDLRVFNAAGELVPHALRRPAPATTAGEWAALPLFPLRGPAARSPEELSLRVEKSASGAIVSVRSGTGATGDAPVVAWLIDASADKRAIDTLEVDWRDPAAGGFSGRLRIDASDDLRYWRIVTNDAALARLRHDGHLLEHRRIELAALRAKYLRLAWAEPGNGVPLTGVRAQRVAEVSPPAREWLALPAAAGERPGEYQFELRGRMPVDRARIRLPQPNMVAAMELRSRERATDPWRLRASGLLYRLNQNGRELANDEFALAYGGGDPYWQLSLARQEGTPAAPVIELGWVPQTLVFVARGDGPFRLAYGSAGLTPGDYSVEQLLQQFAVRNDIEITPQPARLGAALTLGGPERLELPLSARPWRRWLLWGVLGLGVALLGWMAWRLARQLKQAGGA